MISGQLACLWAEQTQSFLQEVLARTELVTPTMLYYLVSAIVIVKGKSKGIPVTGREGRKGCETSRLPHFLDNRFTDSGEVFSLTRPTKFYATEKSWYSFLLEAQSTPGP
jgi:hypothetical protein